MTSFRADRWRPTVSLVAALAAIATSLVLAVLVRRADLVVVAAPLVVGVVVPLLRVRTGSADELTLLLPDGGVWEDELAEGAVLVGTDGTVDAVLVAVQHGKGIELEPPGSLQCVLPPPDGPAQVTLPIRARHWGRSLVGPVTATFTAAHGLLRREARVIRTGSMTVLPLRTVFDATDVVPQASGLVGAHRSRRPGSGTDLHSIRAFAPGDRLRRITWPVSLRTGTLHVTTTTEDRDSDVQLVVDSSVDVGDPNGATGTSLDITVRAAASIAEHYLRQGDRVGLLDLGTLRRPVRLGAGRRHMFAVLSALLGAGSTTRPDEYRVQRQLREVSPRALVMVFSTLLDETIGRHLAGLAQAGHTVLIVDTLPPGAEVPPANPWTPLAWRVALLRRDTLQQRLADFGVPVVAWHGARSLDQVLLGLSRAAAIPRRRR